MIKTNISFCLRLVCLTLYSFNLYGQTATTKLIPIAPGWAKNQINSVIFRHNSIVSHGDQQFVAFYDDAGRVVLAKRKLRTSSWRIEPTQYVGDVKDAHKSISIAVDGAGYLHVVWNLHNTPLQYCRSRSPGSLQLSEQFSMVNEKENRVTYPEFYNLPSGDLLFLYRDGSSGKGDLVLNRFSVKTRKWSRLHDKLIDGEETRSAYWQASVDRRGTIHISWVWRETPDVASNHDICYAKSVDGGKTWLTSSGGKYKLPITADSAEYVVRVPQQSDLINQTSMTTDEQDRPYIVSYWRRPDSQIPQYQLFYHDGRRWLTSQVTQRTSPFTLKGLGTRRIPISRPQILVGPQQVIVIFRDAERGDRISVAQSKNLNSNSWTISDLTTNSVGMWEPTYDLNAWLVRKELHLFVQSVGQGDAEGLENIPPQMISVLEWKP